MTELWAPIAEFPAYEVSNLGRVRRDGRLKKLRRNHQGYIAVVLWSQSQGHTRLLAPLVAAAFIGPQPDGCVACHQDGIKASNEVSNLRWDTPSGNEADKHIHGTARVRDEHPFAKLNEATVLLLRQRCKPGSRVDGIRALAREYGLSQTAMRRALNGYNWKPL